MRSHLQVELGLDLCQENPMLVLERRKPGLHALATVLRWSQTQPDLQWSAYPNSSCKTPKPPLETPHSWTNL